MAHRPSPFEALQLGGAAPAPAPQRPYAQPHSSPPHYAGPHSSPPPQAAAAPPPSPYSALPASALPSYSYPHAAAAPAHPPAAHHSPAPWPAAGTTAAGQAAAGAAGGGAAAVDVRAPVCVVSVLELATHNGLFPIPCAIACCVARVAGPGAAAEQPMVFHRLLNPGPVPPGQLRTAVYAQDHVHGVSMHELSAAESRYGHVLLELRRFMEAAARRHAAALARASPAPGQHVPIAVFAKAPRKVNDTLRWLQNNAKERTHGLGEVRAVEELVEALYAAASLPAPGPSLLQRLFPVETVGSAAYRARFCAFHRQKAEAHDSEGKHSSFHCAHANALSILHIVREEAKGFAV